MADITVTNTEFGQGSGSCEDIVAGEAMDAGVLYYTSGGVSKKAQCDGTAAEADVRGFTTCDMANGQKGQGVRTGTVDLGATAAPVQGTVYVLSEAAGKCKPAADLDASDRVVIVGVGGATHTLQLGINNTGLTVPAA